MPMLDLAPLANRTLAEAAKGLKAQGLEFDAISLQAIQKSEVALGDLSARVMSATIAQRALHAVAKGASPREAVAQALAQNRPQVQAAFDTNLRLAYGHGQYRRAMESKEPLVTFVSKGDSQVRPAHRTLHGVTLPKGHQFWQDHWAPLGWGCRCENRLIDAATAEARGLTVLDEAPEEKTKEYVNKRTGDTEVMPVSAAPGWLSGGMSPSIDPRKSLSKVLQRKLRELAEMAEEASL